MRSKLALVLTLLAALAVMVGVVSAQDDGVVVVEPGDPVVIGLASIRTGEGLVPLGDDIIRGAELALAERPTVTVGDEAFEVEFDVQDDQCSAEGGQAVANYFVSNGVAAVVGPTCSSACRAAGPIFDEASFTMISSSCTAVDLTSEDEGFESFNRTTPNDNGQGVQAATFIYETLGVETIATIHDGSPYGEGLVAVVTATFEELGGTVAVADSINVGDTDFRTLLDTIAQAEVGLIYYGGFPAEAARLMEQRSDVGLGETAFMGADGLFTPEIVELAGDFAEGLYVSTPSPADSEALEAFLATYEETYGMAPTAAFHSYSYDAANMLLDAIEAVGEIDEDGNLVIDREDLAEFIRSFGAEEPFTGLSGVLSCDGSGECALGGIGFFQVEEGEFVRLEAEMMAEE